MEVNSFIKSLHNSSDLVRKWGQQSPPGKLSVRSLLTVEGVSVWDLMAVELALYLIPDCLAEKSGRRTLRQILTPYLRPIKYAFWRASPVDSSDCARWPSSNTALFIGFTPYMARDVLQPVIDLMLNEHGLTPVLLTALPASSNDGKAPEVHSIHCHRSRETVKKARELAKSIRRASSVLTGDYSYRQIFADDKRPLWPLVKGGLRRAFNVHASFFLPDTIAVARHILTDHRPSVIVSIDVADPRTRVYSQLGAMLGIPTVQVQSGAVDQGVVEWRFLLDDVVVAQGGQAKDVFLSHGVPLEKIHVEGSPRYDSLVAANDLELKAFRERFSVPQKNRAVLFASSYFLEIFNNNLAETGILIREMKKAMFAAVAAVPGITLIVKPHPLENVVETRALVEDGSRIVFADPKEDIRPLVRACDAFFTLGSTSTLDGLILGKPTVCPAFPGWVISDHFIQTGAVAVSRSESDIVNTLREIAADGGAEILLRHATQRRKYLDSVVRDNGKGAARRIADLLNSLARPAGLKHDSKF